MYDDETYEDIPYAPISTIITQGNMFTGSWRTMRPILDKDKCINCNTCWKFCPDVAIMTGEKYVTMDYSICKGCGICAEECPVDAITMIREMEARK